MKDSIKSNVYAIDLGYGHVKVATNFAKGQNIFPSVVYKAKNKTSLTAQMLGSSQSNYFINLNNKGYYVGDSALKQNQERIFLNQGEFDADTILALIATALHTVTPKDFNPNNLELVLGLPLSTYLNDRAIANIKQIVSDVELNIVINDDEHTFRIARDKVSVLPQGIGAYAYLINNHKEFYDERIAVIDIGFRTVDCTSINSGDIVESMTFSLEEDGMAYIYENIATKLNEHTTRTYKTYQIEDMLLNRPKDEKISKVIDEVLKTHTRKVVSEIRKRWGEDIKSVDKLILTGGGGAVLIELYKEELANIILQENAQFANCLGYLTM